ncbi:SDR family oxidoreductase [Klebsiella sp. ZJOU C1]|uniref:SDR family oxidoreductase n=1 Tax=Klebsiella sp. ZJOU C1 TaxID=3111629 RepID=UPI002D78B4E4|nr:SDR family oxidoreductase [Klebsiella sp. ZJOU C1]WRR61813.1 SDR family oxidoreductase [Klebsiella sp. ZJOU C1]
MQIKGSVAFVTGANRGIGKTYVKALLEAGASKVYAAARNPTSIEAAPGVVPVKLDVTSAADIAAAVALAKDVTLVINNAGISTGNSSEQSRLVNVASLRQELEVNAIGLLEVSLAFSSVLAANGGGAIVNMHSVLSWFNLPSTVSYSASKAAAWSITNGLRLLLAQQGTQVVGVHVAFVDTDMTAGINGVSKAMPEEVVRRVLEGVERGEVEVLADAVSEQIKQNLSNGVYLSPISST